MGNRTDYIVDGYNAETLTSISNGELLENGVNAGNIYLNGSGTKSDELHVLKTGFVSMFTSTDDGGNPWIRGESPNDGRFINKGTDKERIITSQSLNIQKGDPSYELTESQIVQLDDGRLA